MATFISSVSTDELIAEYLITRGVIILDELIKRHLHLSNKIAANLFSAFQGRTCSFDDFHTWAQEGIWKGIETFDSSKGNQSRPLSGRLLSRVLTIAHKHSIDEYRKFAGHRCSTILAQAHEKYLSRYYAERGHYPTFEEIESEMQRVFPYDPENRTGLLSPTAENIKLALQVTSPTHPLYESENCIREDRDEYIMGKNLMDLIFNCNRYGLNEEDRQMMYYLFVKEMTPTEVGNKIGCTDMQVINRRIAIIIDIRAKIGRERRLATA